MQLRVPVNAGLMAGMWTTLLLALNYIVAWAVVLRVLTRPRMEPSVRIAWIMVVEAVPYVGIIAYLLFGEVRIAHAERQRAAVAGWEDIGEAKLDTLFTGVGSGAPE